MKQGKVDIKGLEDQREIILDLEKDLEGLATPSPEVLETQRRQIKEKLGSIDTMQGVIERGGTVTMGWSEIDMDRFYSYKKDNPMLEIENDRFIGQHSYYFVLQDSYIEGFPLSDSRSASVTSSVLIGAHVLSRVCELTIEDSVLEGVHVLCNSSFIYAFQCRIKGKWSLSNSEKSAFVECSIKSDALNSVKGCVFVNCDTKGLDHSLDMEKFLAENEVYDGVPPSLLKRLSQERMFELDGFLAEYKKG